MVCAYVLGVYGTYVCWQAEQEERGYQKMLKQYLKMKAIEERERRRDLEEPLI